MGLVCAEPGLDGASREANQPYLTKPLSRFWATSPDVLAVTFPQQAALGSVGRMSDDTVVPAPGCDPTTPNLGRLTTVPPRDVWTREAHDFTPWLLKNVDVLSDLLGMDLALDVAEHPVGGFSLDLMGRDLSDDSVVIVENQLEQSDHSHLGQILTYAAGTNPIRPGRKGVSNGRRLYRRRVAP
jgi:hypothetical protein